MKRRSFVQACLAVLGFGAVAKASEPKPQWRMKYRTDSGEWRELKPIETLQPMCGETYYIDSATATDSLGNTYPVKVEYSANGVPSVTVLYPQ